MVQRDPSLLKSVKKNTLGTLFVFEVIRFRKKLLNLKEHPIPSLGLSVVLHRESFCFCAEHKNQMLASVITMQAWLQLSAYAFVLLFDYGRITPNTSARSYPSKLGCDSRLTCLCFLTFHLFQLRLPYVFACYKSMSIIDLRICAIIRLGPYNAKHCGSDIGVQALLHHSPYVFVFFDLPPFPPSLALGVCAS